MEAKLIMIFCLLPAISCLIWKNSTVDQNNTLVTVCKGDNLTLDWDFELQPPEHIVNIEWYFVNLYGDDSPFMIATQVGSVFLPVPGSVIEGIQFLPKAGVYILNVTDVKYTGNYSVTVHVSLHDAITTYTLSASVTVVDENSTRCLYSRQSAMEKLENLVDELRDDTIVLHHAVSTLQHRVAELTRENANMTQEVTSLREHEHAQDVIIHDLQEAVNQLLNKQPSEVTNPTPTSTTKTTATTTPPPPAAFADCYDVLRDHNFDPKSSGVYNLTLSSGHQVAAYCDQEHDGGGWTVVQRRSTGLLQFNKNFQQYRDGFGSPDDEYWIGLENIHLLTAGNRSMYLMVTIKSDFNQSGNAVYSDFLVTSEGDGYKLHATFVNGTAGDSINFPTMTQTGWPFSTPDRDNDGWSLGHCASYDERYGGWWYGYNCGMANPNGHYRQPDQAGILWYTWKHTYTSISYVDLKIRCRA